MVDAAGAAPVIVLSEFPQDRVAVACIAAGAADFLAGRDLDPHTLRKTLVHAWARGTRPRSSTDGIEVGERRENTAITMIRRSPQGDVSLTERLPRMFVELTRRYARLFDPYLHSLVVRTSPPRKEMRAIAQALAECWAAPADMMSIHKKALSKVVQGVGPARADGYRKQGRLLALEMMGYLADFYRIEAGGSRAVHDPDRGPAKGAQPRPHGDLRA